MGKKGEKEKGSCLTRQPRVDLCWVATIALARWLLSVLAPRLQRGVANFFTVLACSRIRKPHAGPIKVPSRPHTYPVKGGRGLAPSLESLASRSVARTNNLQRGNRRSDCLCCGKRPVGNSASRKMPSIPVRGKSSDEYLDHGHGSYGTSQWHERDRH